MTKYDIIVIGAGHNGLVAACYLAKAGLKTLVLERREQVGGACITQEIHAGFRVSALADMPGPLIPRIANDLKLERHALEVTTSPARILGLLPDGRSLCLFQDTAPTVAELKNFSPKDAESYPKFEESLSRIGHLLSPLLTMTPPMIDKPAAGEVWELGKFGLAFRRLGKKDEYRLLRWGPMAIADLVAEWFETELMRAMIAARGIFGAFAGPWSAGTSLGLLWQSAIGGHPVPSSSFVKGGMGALSRALAGAAEAAGAEIRTNAKVAAIETNRDEVSHVVLESGEQLPAWTAASDADPGTTLLELINPMNLDPTFLGKVRNYRAEGVSAKVNFALSGLPCFTGTDCDDKLRVSGRIHIGSEIDYLERAFDAAKYGNYSPAPYMEITIPSLTDPTLAPAGAHVMSVYVQYAPYQLRDGNWESRRDEFADAVTDTLESYAPGLKQLIVGRQVLTPADLEDDFGLRHGHIHHGEQSLDQFFTFRPLIGWAQYRTPIKGLYLCGAGTHPGGGITGGPGFNAAREIVKDFKKRQYKR